jgi:hypothetical protein
MREDLEKILRLAIRSETARLHTSIPAKIKSYDVGTQRATIRLIVDHARLNDEGQVEQFVPPLLQNVPVQFPQGAGYSITWPLNEGDEGTLIFNERSTSEYKATGADRNTPQNLRRFNLTDAVFLPGSARGLAEQVLPDAMVFAGGTFVFGDKAVTTFLARADKVTERLNAIEQYLQTHEHFYVNPAGGLPLITTGKEPPIAPTTVESQIRCNKIKGD